MLEGLLTVLHSNMWHLCDLYRADQWMNFSEFEIRMISRLCKSGYFFTSKTFVILVKIDDLLFGFFGNPGSKRKSAHKCHLAFFWDFFVSFIIALDDTFVKAYSGKKRREMKSFQPPQICVRKHISLLRLMFARLKNHKWTKYSGDAWYSHRSGTIALQLRKIISSVLT